MKHRSRVAADPARPGLRQVHLIRRELFADPAVAGFALRPGDLGENVPTEGLDRLALPRGTRLSLGSAAIVEATGLRNPWTRVERFRKGLLAAVLDRAEDGSLVREAGIIRAVIAGGEVRRGDAIEVALPVEPRVRLERV